MMSGKSTFVLRMSYQSILAEMSDKQVGTLIKAVFNYVATGDEPTGLNDVEVKTAFKFIKQDIDYDTQKYADLCQKRAVAGKSGGRPSMTGKKQKKQMVSQKPNGLREKPVKHNDNDVVVDVVNDSDSDLNGFTETDVSEAPPDPNAGTFLAEPKTKIQRFGVWFVKNYWPELYQRAGAQATGEWFKRNGKALSAVLKLADGDLCLAVAAVLATEEQMVDFEKRKGEPVQWGLEAVARNFADNFKTAQALIASGLIPQEVKNYAEK